MLCINQTNVSDLTHVQALLASPRDLLRLQGVHPVLQNAVLSILKQLPMFVVYGVRTADEQHALWLQRPPVTHCDGYVTKSAHQVRTDGLGHAVDCAFLGPDPFALTHPWEAYGAAVKAAGLIWGGTWATLVDRLHAELP